MQLRSVLLFLAYLALLLLFGSFLYKVCQGPFCYPATGNLIVGVQSYSDAHLGSLFERLQSRVAMQPFNLASLILFVLAILHTFFAYYFFVLSQKIRERNIRLKKDPIDSFLVEALHFMGEIEVVFGVWVVPLFLSMVYFFNWETAVQYINGIEYTEPMFVVVIMTIAASRPIVQLAEDVLHFFANLGRGSTKSWWWAILTLGPISGSLITEPGAMTISALLLVRQFYRLKPSAKFAYATLGLLFTNISVGGVFTNFAAPPVLMVSKAWGWDSEFMVLHFGWKTLLGIVISNSIYAFLFRKEFARIDQKKKELDGKTPQKSSGRKIPFGISLVHVAFLAWTVVNNHYPVMFIGAFLLFLGFYQATMPYQKKLELKPAVLVGFFLAGLMVHGNLQAWWISPVLGGVGEGTLLLMSGFLTAFNDNAQITFLATLIPAMDAKMKYAVVAGAVAGGGLTVIANAPNPAGESILGKYFEKGISAFCLLLGALLPTFIVGMCFWLLRGV